MACLSIMYGVNNAQIVISTQGQTGGQNALVINNNVGGEIYDRDSVYFVIDTAYYNHVVHDSCGFVKTCKGYAVYSTEKHIRGIGFTSAWDKQLIGYFKYNGKPIKKDNVIMCVNQNY